MLDVLDRRDGGQARRACVPRPGALLGSERDRGGVAHQRILRYGAVHPALRSVGMKYRPSFSFSFFFYAQYAKTR